jgi:hypothetical protein
MQAAVKALSYGVAHQGVKCFVGVTLTLTVMAK